MVVEASWLDSEGGTANFPAELQLVSRNVGFLRLMEKLSSGQQITHAVTGI
jgi:hypothetical protein